jgi:hypothetical protein
MMPMNSLNRAGQALPALTALSMAPGADARSSTASLLGCPRAASHARSRPWPDVLR